MRNLWDVEMRRNATEFLMNGGLYWIGTRRIAKKGQGHMECIE